MQLAFRTRLADALSSEAQLRERLETLPPQDWQELAALFAAALPELDLLLALPGGRPLARALGEMRGLPVLDVTAPDFPPDPVGGEAVLVTGHLTDGVPELTALLRAEHFGLRVGTVLAAIDRTNAPGRTRLELQAVRVRAAVRLADTPSGLAFERRTPPPWARVS